MHSLCLVLWLLSVLPADAGNENQRPLLSSYASQQGQNPPSAPVADSTPTAHVQLPPAPRPALRPWMLSVEGTTRAPVDIGAQLTLESPYRLRISLGYGWIPEAYSGLFTRIASSASGNSQVAAILGHANYQGRTLRALLGVRPFSKSGLHLDFGYARLSLDGALDLASSGVPVLEALGGGYRANAAMDAWLIEIGSQVEGWGVVFGFAVGLMHVFDAHTTISAVDGAPGSPVLGIAAQQTDEALKTYGYVPTLTLRLGFDLLSVRSWRSDRKDGPG